MVYKSAHCKSIMLLWINFSFTYTYYTRLLRDIPLWWDGKPIKYYYTVQVAVLEGKLYTFKRRGAKASISAALPLIKENSTVFSAELVNETILVVSITCPKLYLVCAETSLFGLM